MQNIKDLARKIILLNLESIWNIHIVNTFLYSETTVGGSIAVLVILYWEDDG